MPHEQAGGFSTKCEEEVAKLPLPPLAHENGLQPRPQRPSWLRDPWSLPVMETPGLFSYHLRPSVSVLCYSISGG